MTNKRTNKYGVRIDAAGKAARTVDGIVFASMKEARRYGELRLLERAGAIHGLTLQPRYPLVINGIKVCTYIGDMRYYEPIDPAGPRGKVREVVEDCKGVRTPVYKLKKKLMLACHEITIREV